MAFVTITCAEAWLSASMPAAEAKADVFMKSRRSIIRTLLLSAPPCRNLFKGAILCFRKVSPHKPRLKGAEAGVKKERRAVTEMPDERAALVKHRKGLRDCEVGEPKCCAGNRHGTRPEVRRKYLR